MRGQVGRRVADEVSVQKVLREIPDAAQGMRPALSRGAFDRLGHVADRLLVPDDRVADIVVGGKDCRDAAAEQPVTIAGPWAMQRRVGQVRGAIHIERRCFSAGVGLQVERADKDIIRIDQAVSTLRKLQRRGDFEDLLNVPAVDRLGPERPPYRSIFSQHERQEFEPARQQLRAWHDDATCTIPRREQRNVVVFDEDVVPGVTREMPLDAIAKQREQLDVVAVCRRNERYIVFHHGSRSLRHCLALYPWSMSMPTPPSITSFSEPAADAEGAAAGREETNRPGVAAERYRGSRARRRSGV